MKKFNIEEIKRLAFLKYKLNGKRSMNTFIFSQATKNNLTDNEIDSILKYLDKQIKKYNNAQIKDKFKDLKFTCNIF